MGTWGQSQILTGADQTRALALVDEIVSAVVPWSTKTLESRPLAELALFLATVSQRREVDVDFSDLIQRSIDAATAKPLRLCLDGLLSWSLAMDQVIQLLGSQSDICEASDRCLAESLEVVTPEADLQTDLFHGTAGCLAYLAQRPSTPLVERVRTGLLERFEAQVGQMMTTSDSLDVGYAHGLAGLAAVLSDAVEGGWGHQRERQMLSRCVERILASRSSGRFSFPFPSGSGRVAWCRCDLGISIALLKSGRAMGESGLVELARSIALKMASVEPEASGVFDASLCHGAAGAGLMLGLLGDQLKEPEVLASAVRWLNRVSTYRLADAPLAGFFYRVRPEEGERDNVSIVQGVSGVGLALELACGNVGGSEGWLKAFLFV